ncbi:MAG: M14 family metallopeptidase [Myxococcota bacterium]
MHQNPALSTTLSYQALTETLQQLTAAHPRFLELISVGQSREGRTIWAVAVGDRTSHAGAQGGSSQRDERPALYVDGNIHAVELTGSTACLRLLFDLVERTQTEEGQQHLQAVTYYILPRISPDGAEHFLNTGEFLRSVPMLYPHQEWPEGLSMKDLDGDKAVRQMRWPDPDGDYRVSKEDPRVMVRRSFTDVEGPFYRVLVEGLLHQFDGKVVKRAPAPFGADYNRSFPNAWKQDNEQSGAGPMPLAHPETRALAEFILAHPNIGLFLALHTGIEVLIPPEGAKPFSEFPEEDRVLHHRLGQPGAEILKMPMESLFPVDYGKVHGDFGEWLYAHLGIPGFVAELWCPAARAGISLKDYLHGRMGFKEAEPADLATAKWYDSQGITGELTEWKPFEHPQLGSVELGGWRQGHASQAPDGPVLEEIGGRVSQYAQLLARALPRVYVRTLEAQKLGEGLYQVDAVVWNGGFLPSHLTRSALSKRVARPVQLRLSGPEALEVVSGQAKQELGHLDGYGDHALAHWIVKAEAGTVVKLHLDAHRAGQRQYQLLLG